jgi:lambda repressor-like predicted transcriptional regulator
MTSNTAGIVSYQAREVQRAIANRDRAICKMHDEGASLREIAKAAGMSHGGVRKIIDRR